MKQNEILMVGKTVLPAPASLSIGDEIIWSSSTGRTLSGLMAGDVVAEKKTLNIKWGILTEKEYLVIKNALISGFFPVTFHDDGIDLTVQSYRGTISKDILGRLNDGIYYYRSVSVDIIQQ